jgi:hypothetical protein
MGRLRLPLGIHALVACLALGVALVGSCGGTATIEPSATGGGGGATGGGGGATGGSGGSGGVVSPECQVPTSDSPPHAVTFRFHNPGDVTLFMRQSCWFEFSISACADDYAQDLELWMGCSVDCADPAGGCIACEMCGEFGVPIDPGQSIEVTWPGLFYTFDTNADDCLCHDDHPEPAGLHRITVPVYLSAEAAEAAEPSYEVPLDFPLPAQQGVVVVPLAMLM